MIAPTRRVAVQIIRVNDTIPPIITCQPNRTNEWVTGAVPVFGDPTASDTCDTNVTITFVDSELAATCPAVRIFRRTWTATDDCTNRASCSQTITFIDTTPPVITCQPNRTNECATGAVPVFGDPTASDTCDTNVTITFVDDQLAATCPAVRIFRRTWTATDDCTNRASCAQLVVFVDTTPPVITCQPNRTNECATGAVPVFGDPTASDTCDTNVTITFVDDQLAATCPAVRIFRRTWTATDDCTNRASCAQLVVFVDTTPPVITCQPNRTNECATGAVPVFGDPTASDTCDTNVTITFVDDQLAATCPAVRIFRRTWTATDDCTNRASCAQLVVFVDTTPPVITCPTNFSVQCSNAVPACPTNLAAFLALGGTASDTCDTNLTYSCSDAPLTNGICGGTIRRTHTVTDDCTNSASCVQIITVRDTTRPIITCPPDKTFITANCTACPPGTNLAGTATATDNCDTSVDVTYTDSVTGTCPKIVTRTWKATDDCGNSNTCVQVIRCLPPSLATDSSLCTYDLIRARAARNFRLIYTQDPQNWPCYKVTASNPGQTFYNVFADRSDGDRAHTHAYSAVSIRDPGSESDPCLRRRSGDAEQQWRLPGAKQWNPGDPDRRRATRDAGKLRFEFDLQLDRAGRCAGVRICLCERASRFRLERRRWLHLRCLRQRNTGIMRHARPPVRSQMAAPTPSRCPVRRPARIRSATSTLSKRIQALPV
jgi:hypothetical protein